MTTVWEGSASFTSLLLADLDALKDTGLAVSFPILVAAFVASSFSSQFVSWNFHVTRNLMSSRCGFSSRYLIALKWCLLSPQRSPLLIPLPSQELCPFPSAELQAEINKYPGAGMYFQFYFPSLNSSFSGLDLDIEFKCGESNTKFPAVM